jgi:hypothetical protein
MTAFTRLGSSLWDWEPWTDLAAPARILWLALYTSAEAKRHVPGLWHGGIPTMADAARMAPDDVIAALDRLLERDLVEYDPKFRVLRLCELPDPGERPSNGKVILGWWTRFGTVPACPVRDSHVKTLAWICHEGSKLSGKEFTPDHVTAWERTFGTIVVPQPRRRGIRRLADSDTGTQVQPSLFPPSPVALGSGNGIAPQGECGYPQHPHPAVDNSAALHQPKEIRGPETVSDTVWDTNRIPDPGSRIPEDLSFSSGEGDRGRARPVLALVPAFTAAEVIRELSQGKWDPAFDRTHQNALSALIPVWTAASVTLADIALLREYSAISGQRMSARWLAGCDMVAEVSKARRTLDLRDVRAKAMADSMP